jgi:hypothetical protein
MLMKRRARFNVKSRLKYGVTASLAALLMGVSLVPVAQSDRVKEPAKAEEGLPGWVMNIPLSKRLPTDDFAVLGEGVIRKRRWAIFTFANDRPRAKERPCIEHVNLRYEHGVISITNGAPSCGGLAPFNPVPVTTEYVFTKVAGAVVGMTVDPSVARLRMVFSNGQSLHRATQLLSVHQAAKAKVKRFRFVAMGISQKTCLESLQGFSNSGDVLFQTPSEECLV